MTLVAIWLCFCTTGPHRADQPIPIGMIIPRAGSFAPFGELQRRAAQLAIDVFALDHAQPSFELIVRDSEQSPEQGLAAFADLRRAHDVRFCHAASSGVALAIAPQCEAEGCLLITDAASERVSRECSRTLRHCPDARAECEFIAGSMSASQNRARAALLHVSNAYGEAYPQPFRDAMLKRGGEVVHTGAFADDQADFGPLVEAMLTTRPDAVYCLGFGRSLASVIERIKTRGFTGRVYAASSVVYANTYAFAPAALEGVRYPDIWVDLGSENPAIRSVVAGYRQRWNQDPSPLVFMTYDAFAWLLDGIAACGPDPQRVMDWLRHASHRAGVTGDLRLHADGHLIFDLRLLEVRDGKPVLVK